MTRFLDEFGEPCFDILATIPLAISRAVERTQCCSQVIVLGRYDPAITGLPWDQRKSCLWPVVVNALQSLRADFQQVVIEGAGSPAEINLRQGDIVNMSVAKECAAEVYLVSDIDRGGSFAHLFGTRMYLEPDEQALVRGSVLIIIELAPSTGDTSVCKWPALSPGLFETRRKTAGRLQSPLPAQWRPR